MARRDETGDGRRREDGKNLVTEGSLGQGLVDGSLMGGGVSKHHELKLRVGSRERRADTGKD